MSQYFQEAFKRFDLLQEEDFNLDASGIDELDSFLKDSEDKIDFEDVIDPEAETEEELEDSYIGKVILDCNVCHSKIYKNAEDVNFDEETEIADEGEECPFCYSADGFTIVGQVAPYQETEIKVDVEPKEDEVEETEVKIEESKDKTLDFDEAKKFFNDKGLKFTKDLYNMILNLNNIPNDMEMSNNESLKEGIENLDVETEHDKIHIEAEEKEPTGEEVIAPIEPAQEADILADVNSVEEVPEEEEIDVDIDDFEEEPFNTMGESYLKKVYENVNSFKTTKVSSKGNELVIEGIINFKSGKEKKTTFKFESKTIDKNNNVRFLGENLQISKGKKSFTLRGTVNENKFTPSSFRYNYRVDGNRVYGTIKNEALKESRLSDEEGTASNAMSKVMNQLDQCTSAKDVYDLVNKVVPEDKKKEPKVKKLLLNLSKCNDLVRAQTAVTNFILKGDGLGSIEKQVRGKKEYN